MVLTTQNGNLSVVWKLLEALYQLLSLTVWNVPRSSTYLEWPNMSQHIEFESSRQPLVFRETQTQLPSVSLELVSPRLSFHRMVVPYQHLMSFAPLWYAR